jgi:hypothetical protein
MSYLRQSLACLDKKPTSGYIKVNGQREYFYSQTLAWDMAMLVICMSLAR